MDQATLVKADRELQAHIMEALSQSKVPVTFIDWDYVPQLKEWQLVIATPWYDTKGPRTTIRSVIDAFEKARIYEQVPMRRVFVRSPEDPLVRTLEREARERKEGFLHLLRHGDGRNRHNRYAVFFGPTTPSGGALPSKTFSGEAELSNFLSHDLGIRQRLVDEALDDLNANGASSIFPVTLTTRQMRKPALT